MGLRSTIRGDFDQMDAGVRRRGFTAPTWGFFPAAFRRTNSDSFSRPQTESSSNRHLRSYLDFHSVEQQNSVLFVGDDLPGVPFPVRRRRRRGTLRQDMRYGILLLVEFTFHSITFQSSHSGSLAAFCRRHFFFTISTYTHKMA